MEISYQLLQKLLMVVLLLAVLFDPGQKSIETPLMYDTGALFHWYENDMKTMVQTYFC